MIAANPSTVGAVKPLSVGSMGDRFNARDITALLVISCAVFLIALDLTIVAIAIPDVQRSLSASYTSIQWLLNGYTLAFSSLLLTMGSLADRFGRKRLFLAGLALFGLASALCAAAPSVVLLNAARLAQGASGAAMLPTAIALLAHMFDGHRRAVAFATFGTTFGLGLVGGPIVGGALVSGFGWQAVFLLNIPVTIVACLIGRRALTESSDPGAGQLDAVGAVLSTGALTCLFYALIAGSDYGWASAPVLFAAGGFAIFLFGFVVVERRLAEPMIDLSLFGNRTFVGMSLLTFLQGASFWCLPIYLPMFLQNVRGDNPLAASLVLLPLTVPLLLLPHVGALISARVSSSAFLAIGMVATGLGILVTSRLSPESGWLQMLPGLLLAGIATGIINNQITNLAVAIVPLDRAGMASGTNTTFRHVGYGAGIAGLGAVVGQVTEHDVRAELVAKLPGLPTRQVAEIAASTRTGAADAASIATVGHGFDLPTLAHAAFTNGLSVALLVAGALSIVAGLTTLLLVRGNLIAVATDQSTTQ